MNSINFNKWYINQHNKYHKLLRHIYWACWRSGIHIQVTKRNKCKLQPFVLLPLIPELVFKPPTHEYSQETWWITHGAQQSFFWIVLIHFELVRSVQKHSADILLSVQCALGLCNTGTVATYHQTTLDFYIWVTLTGESYSKANNCTGLCTSPQKRK